DWAELDRRFGAAGVGDVLATYLHFAEVLLGQAAPRLSHTPRANALAQLRRVIEPDVASWLKVPLEYLAARRRNPLGVINLLRPGTWRKGLRLLAESRAPKW